jgi:hypothetical protein
MNRYPIYGKPGKAKPGLYLGLFHGFTSEKKRQEADDWGSNGPMIGPLEFVHTTYASHIKFKFVNADDATKYGLENLNHLIVNNEDCIVFGRKQYGDWTVFNHPVKD